MTRCAAQPAHDVPSMPERIPEALREGIAQRAPQFLGLADEQTRLAPALPSRGQNARVSAAF